jgi:hypothetical protein
MCGTRSRAGPLFESFFRARREKTIHRDVTVSLRIVDLIRKTRLVCADLRGCIRRPCARSVQALGVNLGKEFPHAW